MLVLDNIENLWALIHLEIEISNLSYYIRMYYTYLFKCEKILSIGDVEIPGECSSFASSGQLISTFVLFLLFSHRMNFTFSLWKKSVLQTCDHFKSWKIITVYVEWSLIWWNIGSWIPFQCVLLIVLDSSSGKIFESSFVFFIFIFLRFIFVSSIRYPSYFVKRWF